MPFTPSHVVAILPFVRTPLAPAALALGSMAPDIPYFLPIGLPRELSHSLPGVPTVDLLVGLVAFALWVLVLRAPVLDYSPAWLRERMAPRARWRVKGWVLTIVLVIAALELGILTHLFLDLFTHEGGWLESVLPWTSHHVGPFTIINLVHGVVSVVTGLIVALWVRRWALRTPRTERATRLRERERLLTWSWLLAVIAVVGLAWWITGIAAGMHPFDTKLMGKAFFIAVAVSGAIAVVLAIVWWRRDPAVRLHKRDLAGGSKPTE